MTTDKREIDAMLQVQHFFSAGWYCKLSWLPKGVPCAKHTHSFSHDSVLVIGTVELEVDGDKRTLTGPCIVRVEAGKAHVVTPRTDALWGCVHETDEADPERIDHVLTEGN